MFNIDDNSIEVPEGFVKHNQDKVKDLDYLIELLKGFVGKYDVDKINVQYDKEAGFRDLFFMFKLEHLDLIDGKIVRKQK